MKITTLQERITKAQETIAKKENTIDKKLAQIEKKLAQVEKAGYNLTAMRNILENMDCEIYRKYGVLERAILESVDLRSMERELSWTVYDIGHLADDIRRNKLEIIEKMETLKKYNAQLNGEIEKESIFIKELPENVLQMRDELVERWDEYDKHKRDFLCAQYKALGYHEFSQKYRHAGHEFRKLTDDQIHDANMRDAKNLILNLYNRVKEITGEITSWSGIRLEQGANFSSVLNGYVEGKEGRAYVESILAGGYNIQRLHVRVLVKERM